MIEWKIPEETVIYFDDRDYKLAYSHGIDLPHSGWVKKRREEWLMALYKIQCALSGHPMYARDRKRMASIHDMILSDFGSEVAQFIGYRM